MYQINLPAGTVLNAAQVTLPGFTVFNSLAMAARPSDGELFAVVQTGAGSTTRRLVTVNPTTGVATDIGPLTQAISSLAFRANGTLYAVSGEGGPSPETLFTVNTSNAAFGLRLCAGEWLLIGETHCFPSQRPPGTISSGNGAAIFESVAVDTCVVTPIGTSARPEAFAMGYSPANAQLFPPISITISTRSILRPAPEHWLERSAPCLMAPTVRWQS